MLGNHHEKPKLWVITECYYPEVVSTGQYLTQTAEGLTDQFDVNVICGQPNYLSRGLRAPAEEHRNGVNIFRVWSTLLNKNVVIFRVINMLTLGAAMFWRSLRKLSKGDKILVVTAPPNLPFTTAVASLLKGASYTLLIHDYYPDQLVALGKFGSNSLVVKAMHRANSWLFKHAAKIIVVGRDMAELVASRADGLDVPISTIPNWADIDDVRPLVEDSNELRKKLGLNEKLVVLSPGNIGRPTAVETVAECARIIADDDRFHFVFVGWGAKGEWLRSFIAKHQLSNISMLGQRPRSEQQEFLNACDIGLVSLAGGMWGTAVPSRTYNLLAAGKPVLALCDEDSEIDRLLKDDSIGWRIPPDDPVLMSETLKSIISRSQDLQEMGRRARKAAETKFSLDVALQRYREALK
jgi:glycosyltransferase involved in cell wall biosynthesis